jgi:uncharacterized protein (TIGR02597 family)
MKKTNLLAILTLAATPAFLHAQTTSYSDVVGYTKITLAANSDTIISPQVFRPAELNSGVSGVSTNSTQAVLTLSGASLTASQFVYNSSTQPNTYFVLVSAGNLKGTYFMVASNDTSSITVNLDGLTASSSDITSIEVRPCWTLKTLFPAGDANVSFTPSASGTFSSRRTQILFPSLVTTGVNRAPASTYFFNNTAGVQDWVSAAVTSAKAGDTVILPGTYVIHRNTGGTPVNLSLTQTGAVFAQKLTTYVATSTTKVNDNYVGLPRPTDYTVSQLGITDASFTQSTSKTFSGRKDLLLVVNPTGSGVNRAPSVTYFRYLNDWYSTASTLATNNAVIPAGAAVIIRKVVSDGNDKVWSNDLNTSL